VHGRLDVSSGTFFPYGARGGDLYNFGLINLNASARINGLFGDGVLSKNNSGTTIMAVGDNNATATFNGIIANYGSSIVGLTKIGSGTQTLNGISTYTAATTVSNGVLAINGALASPVTVWSNAVLTGTGLIATNNAAAVTVKTGGILDPGAAGGVGTLSVTGNVVFAGGQLRVDLNGANADLLAVSGNVTASGSVAVASAAGSGPWKIVTAAAITPLFTNVTTGFTLTRQAGDTELWVSRSVPRGTLIMVK
jgi:fibronectin-binding autotransporter adhesin